MLSAKRAICSTVLCMVLRLVRSFEHNVMSCQVMYNILIMFQKQYLSSNIKVSNSDGRAGMAAVAGEVDIDHLAKVRSVVFGETKVRSVDKYKSEII